MDEGHGLGAPVAVEGEVRAPRDLFGHGVGRGYVDPVEPSPQEQPDRGQAASVGVIPQQYRLDQALDIAADHDQFDAVRRGDEPDVLQGAVPQPGVAPVDVESVHQDKAADPVGFGRVRFVLEVGVEGVDAAGKERCRSLRPWRVGDEGSGLDSDPPQPDIPRQHFLHDRVHALVELPGYAAFDDQVLALLHRGQQESRCKRAGVAMSIAALPAVTEAEINPVPAYLADFAPGRQDCRLVGTVQLRILDNHHQSLNSARLYSAVPCRAACG